MYAGSSTAAFGSELSGDVHPDKNPSPEARQQFNDVRDAYEILSSPESKILYDTGGMEAIQEHKKGQVQKGETSQNSVTVTLEMLYSGAEHPVSCTVVFGLNIGPKMERLRLFHFILFLSSAHLLTKK